MSQTRPGNKAPQRRQAPPSNNAVRPVSRQAQPPVRRTASGAPRGQAMKGGSSSGGSSRAGDLIKLIAIGVIVIVLACFLQGLWPDGFPLASNQKLDGSVEKINEIYSSGPIRLNEVMSSNSNSITTEDGDTADWFEIANISNSPVNLGGYEVSKSAKSTNVFVFPDMTLPAGEFVTVFADGKIRANAGEELHAPFRIASSGDTLMLFNAGGTAIDTVNLPRMTGNASYERVAKDKWQITQNATPGMANTAESVALMTQVASDSPVVIAEVSAAGQESHADENGQYPDYIVLNNRSGTAVDLTGWYLSDDADDTRKWRLPSVQLGAGESLTVFASGQDKRDDIAHLHTNFRLSSEGEQVTLSDSKGRRMDVADYGLMKRNDFWTR